MKKIQIAVLALFACNVAIFAVFSVKDFIGDKNQPPVISCEQDTVEVPVAATQEQLCAGLTATDPEDGDVTGQIMVTNISNFVAERTCNISYAVFDSNEQLGEFTRKVVYTDYTSPQFSISEPLEIRMGGEVEILDKLEAKDVIDGDISNRILILNSDVNTATPGKYDVTVQVSNSRGDVAELVLPVAVRDYSVNAPDIVLTQTLVYLKKGETFDPQNYLDTEETQVSASAVHVNSDVDTAQAGTYTVTYTAGDASGHTGTAYLTAVVEG